MYDITACHLTSTEDAQLQGPFEWTIKIDINADTDSDATPHRTRIGLCDE